VRLKNKTQLSRRVLAPKGDPRNPMDFDEIAGKFRDLTRDALSAPRVDQIIHIVKHLEKMENPSALLRLCRVSS
jgi:2-methylcitrate dehydratase PrpD